MKRPIDARRRRDGSASVGGFEDATDRRAGRDGETDDDGSTRSIAGMMDLTTGSNKKEGF